MTTQIIFASLATLLIATSASAKTCSTYYTSERVANARRNIQRYDWAAAASKKLVEQADVYANLSDDYLWDMITPQSIPRGIDVSLTHGCPNCGNDVKKFGNYPWKIDLLAKPWKIECPSCGELFPKNDFKKFYDSGKDENGIFCYEKADKSLLFNADHPDPTDPLHTYAVDDTFGWKDADGNVYRMIGYYGHYGSWTVSLSVLGMLHTAWLYTGDLKYARKAAVMLYRIADFYPDMDLNIWAEQGFYNSDGGTKRGKVFGCIWETGVADKLCLAYDSIYPALDDPTLLADVSKLAGKEVTAADMRALCEKNILHEVHDEIISANISGNEGMHQYSMTLAAIVLDDPRFTDQWLDWLFADGVRGVGIEGGNMTRLFTEIVDDDGMGNEASPGYNAIWRVKFRTISEALQIYGKYTRNSFVSYPKFKKMFEAPLRLICIDKFVPDIGDTGSTGSPGLSGVSLSDTVYAFKTFKDPFFAQMAYLINGNKADMHGGVFESDPNALSKEIEAVIKKHGPWVPRTDDMPSYGCAILRQGSGKNARALSLYYGRNVGHGHRDTLNIELFGYGLSLLPDHGYPEFATHWAHRSESTDHTITHNTVVVDRKRQERNRVGKANFVADGDGASAAEVYAGMPYPQCSLYQRTISMVDLDDSDGFYVVDIFRVKGGSEHLYSLHGPEGEIETESLNLVDQKKGTLAGEDVELYADLGYAQDGYANATGYQYFYDVRRDKNPADQTAITYNVVDTWKIHKEPIDLRVRFDMLNPPSDIILARTQPPRNKPGNPNNLWYLLEPNEGSEATYATVIEPYIGEKGVARVERQDDGDRVIITVTTKSGRKDTIISALKPIYMKLGKTTARFAIFSEQDGQLKTKLAIP
ncbi:MAG: hypothetical protein GX139_01900 [Armatimonadetes bacterium]|nr:hypothetical protein [Armatimonadota bacterium]